MARPQKIVRIEGRLVENCAGKGTYRTVKAGDRVVKKRLIDSEKPDFTAQFTCGFRNNVRRAREENRELQGQR